MGEYLRRATVAEVSWPEQALGPAIRIVVLADIAEQEIGRCLVRNHWHALSNPHRPEVLVPGPVHPMELQSRSRRIELQIERRRLRGPLLLAVQLAGLSGERIGDPKSTAVLLPYGQRVRQILCAIAASGPYSHTATTE